MKVIGVPMKGIGSVTVLAMVGVGSRFEKREKAGISHFLEHLPFKGTQNYPTSLDVAMAIDGIGGKHNAFTSKDYTGYWVKVAATHLERGLDVVSDLLLTPRLRQEDIDREKGVITEEINMYEDNPQYKVAQVFDTLVYEGSPLAMDVAGYKDTVSAMTRSDFLRHYNAWYDPTNVVVGVVGSIKQNHQELLALVEEYFKKGKPRTGGGKKTYGLKDQTASRLHAFYKKTEQAHFYLGFPSISWKDPDRYVLAVLVTLLGGNSSSRLFNEIREKRGLAYYAYASADTFADTGSIYALEGVNLSQIEDAIKVTLEEFDKVAAGTRLNDEEVMRAKEYMIGKMTLDLEDSAAVANWHVRRLLLEGRVTTLEAVLKKVRAVTSENIVGLAKKLFDKNRMNLAIVGPYKKPEKFEKLIR